MAGSWAILDNRPHSTKFSAEVSVSLSLTPLSLNNLTQSLHSGQKPPKRPRLRKTSLELRSCDLLGNLVNSEISHS